MQRAAGKKALITGAAGGLGAAMARMLARHGAKVYLTDLDQAAVGALAARINADLDARMAWSAAQDVAVETQWQSVLTAAGNVATVFNNTSASLSQQQSSADQSVIQNVQQQKAQKGIALSHVA